ncbi:MAG TPA: carboxypeptidase regulatory-like domain-containing protein [Vicinamibacterales bacterium]|nr:carboxypeptidase regulatory-like domain-containing protein [Vicinamibacterales bacterium]
MKAVAVIFASVLALAATTPTVAAQRPTFGTLHIVVHDPSGAVIPGARVQVINAAGASHHITSDGQGVASVSALEPGRYGVLVSFPGFETKTISDVRVRAGETRRDVTLAIEKLDQSVSVGRDPSTVASDPNNNRFNTVLSKEQIDALPDDPDEMESALKEMAGPGATIRVDGFRGGRLPLKSQIRSIRFSRDMFAAENHGGGLVFVDIATQPGLGPLRGGLDVTFRDDSLNARNAFVTEKGAEQTQQYAFNLSGTLLKERTSFSLSAGGASLYDSASILAAVPGGTVNSNVRRPSDRVNVTARVDQALSTGHTLRVSFQENQNHQQNLGVGGFNLAERAYARASDDRLFRIAESGSLSRTVFAETRVQLHWTSTDATSASELPTVQVLDAFTAGGAQQSGGRKSTELEWAMNLDWAKGKHAVRAGALVEGGSYRSDTRANYLGTFTFDSLASYESTQPSTYSRRAGDPLVQFGQWQAGLFVQDDWRVRKNLTISGGLRQELQTHLGDRWNLAPRFGFTWSPFKSGKTTLRGGGGIFHDWLDADTYEQTLRVDGERQLDRIVRNPGYPNPFGGGDDQDVLPASKYSLAANLAMPQRKMINGGISQQLSPVLAVNVSVNHSVGTNRFRGRNINAPLPDGGRPNPLLGNVTQVESTARFRGDSLNVGLNMNIPNRRTVLFANYTWLHQRNDADGPFSLPADSYQLAGEWGPVAGVPHHVFSGMINTAFRRNIRVGFTAAARSGVPYNVTTGRDDNGDTVFNDRPLGVPRNSAWTKGMWDVGARVSYAFGFGTRAATGGPAGGPTVVIQRIGAVGGATDMLNAMGGGGAEDKRVRFELFAAVQNLFNHVNPIGYSGVMTSPFFGQPTAAMPARRIDVGMRIGF